MITHHEWKEKSREEKQQEITDLDTQPVIYKQSKSDIHWEKRPDFSVDFEPNQVNMFRVVLEPNFVGNIEDI